MKWKFNTKELDTKTRPQDDFFGYVNNRWIAANPIPPNESRWGTFIQLRFSVEKQLKKIVDELDTKSRLATGSPEQLVRDFWRSGMDMKRRNVLGAKPLAPLFALVDGTSDLPALTKTIATLHRMGLSEFFGAGIDQDAKNSEQYRLHLVQGGLGMPDRDYYLKSDAESVRVRSAYEVHIEKMLKLIGYTPAEARTGRDAIIAFEKLLAKASMTKEDQRDPNKTYNKFAIHKLKTLTPSIDWNQYLAGVHAGKAEHVIVCQPEFFIGLERALTITDFNTIRSYLRFHIASALAGALSEPFIKQSFSFYGTVLSGTKVMRPLWRRVLGAVNGNLGEILGQIYVELHFPPEAKARVDTLISDIRAAFAERIKALDWMTAPTKRKALTKLDSLVAKIGHPTKWKSYKGLAIDPADYVGNLLRSAQYFHDREMKKLTKPLDRLEWFMYPQTVNAYFAPTLNDIVFPAAILQPPFFSVSADDAENYGCIGAVIAHEITHGFDDEGSKYDAKGNLKDWWTKEDRKRFDAKAKRVEKQFNQYEVADGVKVNGKLTLGENIADLGGLSIAYDAYQRRLEVTGRSDINGHSPEQRFFFAFALFEREHSRPEFQKLQVLNDPHSPGMFRINGPVSNFTPFYDAFGVKKGDALFRPAAQREMVW